MASRIINIPINENIINRVCEHAYETSAGRTAVISGGKRPFLFIKKELAIKYGKSFYSPLFFSNDDFIERIIFDNSDFSKIPDLEAAYILFEIISKEAPNLIKKEKSFEHFLPWAYEILFFIEQLDLESVTEDKLQNLKANAEIGYSVPENINELLKNIFKIRKRFHSILESSKIITKGYSFLKCLNMPESVLCGNFDEVILTAPFYLHKTELEIYKKIFDSGKLTVFTQGNPKSYETLKKIYECFNYPATEVKEYENNFDLNIYGAYDDQSQAALLKNLIKNIPPDEIDKTVVIVPKPEMIQSVVSEVSSVTDNYNVSAGYPAAKTAVFGLLKSIMRAQLSKKDKNYYSKDIVDVITNPLVKNMRFFGDASVSRIIAHKIEQALDSSSKGKLAGKLFIDLHDISNEQELLENMSFTIAGAWKPLDSAKLRNILNDIFKTLFIDWETPETLFDLSEIVLSFLEKVLNLSVIQSYPLDRSALKILISAAEELKYGEVSKVHFSRDEMFNIFEDLLKNKKISLPGSPLKGLQILGLLESRNLSFDNVFILAMNDSSFPAITKNFPLVPKDIMFSLGIEMAKKEYEIQAYHFQRLIAGSKKLDLIYSDNEKEERSRFIEDLVWQKQFLSKDINSVNTQKFVPASLASVNSKKRSYEKTAEIKNFLKNMTYSHTSISSYLRCRLEFYFRYILGLDEGLEVGKEISESNIGEFIHEFLNEAFYEGLKSSEICSEEFKKNYLKKLEDKFDSSFDMKFREDAFLIKEVLMYRMEKLLENEKIRDFGTILACEKNYSAEIETSLGKYKLKCFIDRIDNLQNAYNIYDYKTGAVNKPVILSNFDALIADIKNRKNIKKSIKSFQLPLYKYIFEQNESFFVSEIAFYGVKNAKIVPFPQENEIYNVCINALKEVLDEINSGESFEFDENDREHCEKCKYFYICR
ncbi:MAG: PD-(D/E)XK nuclease family protein [Endomicrobia bacterium]|nr:PD-(D/E)XK nuclease family protein [Endomicrobiia bacterium]MCL2507060.1 PD-(D/E)XK nuclease family protein [Endomicrobiia bacterium]